MSTIETAGRIVVGTDLSHRADRAVDWAAHRASLDGTPLLLVVSLPEVPIPRRARLFTAMQEGDYPAALHERAEHRLTDERELAIYRFVQDTRFGRIVLAESHDVAVIVDAVTDYVARRMIEREHALVATPAPEPVAA